MIREAIKTVTEGKYDAIHKAVKELTKSVASKVNGRIIPFVSRDGNITRVGYSDDMGRRNVLYTFDKPIDKEKEDQLITLIRNKYSKSGK